MTDIGNPAAGATPTPPVTTPAPAAGTVTLPFIGAPTITVPPTATATQPTAANADALVQAALAGGPPPAPATAVQTLTGPPPAEQPNEGDGGDDDDDEEGEAGPATTTPPPAATTTAPTAAGGTVTTAQLIAENVQLQQERRNLDERVSNLMAEVNRLENSWWKRYVSDHPVRSVAIIVVAALAVIYIVWPSITWFASREARAEAEAARFDLDNRVNVERDAKVQAVRERDQATSASARAQATAEALCSEVGKLKGDWATDAARLNEQLRAARTQIEELTRSRATDIAALASTMNAAAMRQLRRDLVTALSANERLSSLNDALALDKGRLTLDLGNQTRRNGLLSAGASGALNRIGQMVPVGVMTNAPPGATVTIRLEGTTVRDAAGNPTIIELSRTVGPDPNEDLRPGERRRPHPDRFPNALMTITAPVDLYTVSRRIVTPSRVTTDRRGRRVEEPSTTTEFPIVPIFIDGEGRTTLVRFNGETHYRVATSDGQFFLAATGLQQDPIEAVGNQFPSQLNGARILMPNEDTLRTIRNGRIEIDR